MLRDEKGRFVKGHEVPKDWLDKMPSFEKGHTPFNKGKTAKEDSRIPHGENHGMYGKHHSEEANQKNREKHMGKEPWNKGKKLPPPWNKGLTKETDERVAKYGEKQKGKPKPSVAGDKNASKRPDVRKKLTEIWQNPEYREKVLNAQREGQKNHPNKPEQQTLEILNKLYPGEFGYNGNLELGIMIGGLIPDFPNINGKKQIIEVFGDVFHDPKKSFKKEIPWHQQEWGRKAYYSQFGYDCLIIWESELKNPEKVIEKIQAFVKD